MVMAGPALADHQPKAFTAEYTVSRNGSDIGVRTHSLKKNSQGYVYTARMQTTGFAAFLKPVEITESSEWLLHNNKIIPQQYTYHDSSDSQRDTLLTFNWQDKTVTNKVANDSWKMSIPVGAQDKFGYLLSLMRDLQHGNTNPIYKIADGGRLKTYRFTPMSKELLQTPLGKLPTLKLRRTRVGKEHRKVYIWCAPSLGYLPVKIERHKKNNIYTMLIEKLEETWNSI